MESSAELLEYIESELQTFSPQELNFLIVILRQIELLKKKK